MQILGSRLKLVIAPSMLLIWGTLAYACGVEDENPATPRRDAGQTGDGTTVDPTADGEVPPDTSLCGKYGGYDGVKAMAAEMLTSAKADCRIQAGFAMSNDKTQHVAECFAIQMGSAFACKGADGLALKYEGGKTEDSKKVKCQSMNGAHQKLNLRTADFNAFRDDVLAVLVAHQVNEKDRQSIAIFLEGTRVNGIVKNGLLENDKNTFCSCPAYPDGGSCYPDAGYDGGDGGDGGGDSGSTDAGVIADTGPADTGPADTGPADTGPADGGTD